MNFHDFPWISDFVSFSASNFDFFLWNFDEILSGFRDKILEKSDVCRFFNRIRENKLDNCRKFWNQILWKLFIVIHYYSLGLARDRDEGLLHLRLPADGRPRPGEGPHRLRRAVQQRDGREVQRYVFLELQVRTDCFLTSNMLCNVSITNSWNKIKRSLCELSGNFRT